MPRPKRPGAPEPKTRSRTGCWNCKGRKVKCGEEKPSCLNCERQGEACDYSIKLTWGGRKKRTPETATPPLKRNAMSYMASILPSVPPASPEPSTPRSFTSHGRLTASPRPSELSLVDPDLMRISDPESQARIWSTGRMGENLSYDLAGLSQAKSRHSTSSFDYRSATAGVQEPFEFDYLMSSSSVSDGAIFTTAHYPSIHTRAPLSPAFASVPALSRQNRNSLPFGQSDNLPNKSHHRSRSDGSLARSAGLSSAATFPGSPAPYSSYIQMPLTPSSLVDQEQPISRKTRPAGSPYLGPDRRFSVQFMLTGPPGDSGQVHSPESYHSRHSPMREPATTHYGYDPGYEDVDMPKNNDLASIVISTPQYETMDYDGSSPAHGAKNMAFEKGEYYAKPVPITISKSLDPLPELLMENPINLMYFHHFINHTARILVPHDCEQNPFRQILPEMAVQDTNILRILLAYSASHRARLLNHPEPRNRIAQWVQDVFPTLRETLTQSPASVSSGTLASAVMLASLEIISPNTFEVPIAWQNHLSIARQMIIARGGPRSSSLDRVSYFLSRWFSYLDVLGSLSGNKVDEPLDSFYWSTEDAMDPEDSNQIDCLMGFTNRCMGLLARVAELAKHCDALRIDENGDIRPDWHPVLPVVDQAIKIRHELAEGIMHPSAYRGCNHQRTSYAETEGASSWDATEIYATNAMFHWGGLIHLYRRVFGKSSTDPEVQHAVREIVSLLEKVRKGSTAEACLLMPMFAAGCEAREEEKREAIMSRLRGVEGFGIAQVQKARDIMQKVWDTGKPWESLVQGEFFG